MQESSISEKIKVLMDILIFVREVLQKRTTPFDAIMGMFMDKRIFILHLHPPVTVLLQKWEHLLEALLYGRQVKTCFLIKSFLLLRIKKAYSV